MSAKKSRQNVVIVGKTDTKMKHICRCTKSLRNEKRTSNARPYVMSQKRNDFVNVKTTVGTIINRPPM
ncbi:MAG: hypothetical protein PUE46_02510 [Eubacteriales bacterium]|nr:hypothetical protein [Eubacteriales bacterium]